MTQLQHGLKKSESRSVGYQVKEVREKYEAWCEENDKTPLKRQFNEVLEVNFNLERKNVTYRKLNPSSNYYALRSIKAVLQ